jgi:hypothetical protein
VRVEAILADHQKEIDGMVKINKRRKERKEKK